MDSTETPPMPGGYIERADALFISGELTAAEAYWQAACELLGIKQPPLATAIRVQRTDAGWVVRYRVDGKARQRSFTTRVAAESYRAYLFNTRAGRGETR